MADGRVIIDASLDTSDIRRDVQAVNQELGQIGDTMPAQVTTITNEVGERFDSLGRRIRSVYRGTSPEAQRMSSEIRSAFAQQRVAMSGLRDDMIGVQYGYFKMAQGAKNYQGTNDEFMAGIETMGKKHKKINDNMIAANDMQRMNFYQSVGSMLARSTQASKISDNFDRMNNPLYKVNNGLLNVADGMNKIAMRGQPAALALKMLGPTANMKQLQDMTMMISQGLMRFTMVAMIAAVGAGIFYKAMHDGAMETNAAYATAFKGMLTSVREAFQPMIDVFAAVMTPVWNFIGAIAQLVVKFNEANPVLSKVIAGFLLLIPALTLILSPLAIGIGLFGGLQAAMGAVWMIIGPIVTGFAAMMGTVLLVAAVIAGLGAAFYLLWTRSETFKNGVISGWEAIKSAAISVFNFIKPYIMQAIDAVATFVQQGLSKIQKFWSENGTQIMGIVKAAWTIVSSILSGALAVITSIFKGVFPVIVTIVQTAWEAIKTVITVVSAIVSGIIKTWLAVLRGDWSGAWNSIKSTYETIWNAIKSFLSVVLNAMAKIITQLFTAYKNTVDTIMTAIGNVIKAIWNAIKSTVTTILSSLGSAVTSAFNSVRSTVSSVMESVKSVISNAWHSAKSTVTSVVNAIKSVVSDVFNSLKSTVSTAMNNVKSAIETGWNAAKSFLEGIDLSGIGKDIIQGLIGGITSMVSAVGDAIGGIADKIKSGISKAMDVNSPSRWMRDKIGKMLPAGIAVGIESNLKSVDGAVTAMANRIKSQSGLGIGSQAYRTAQGGIANQTIDRGVTQNVTINSPKALSPAETARANKRVAQQLAMGWN